MRCPTRSTTRQTPCADRIATALSSVLSWSTAFGVAIRMPSARAFEGLAQGGLHDLAAGVAGQLADGPPLFGHLVTRQQLADVPVEIGGGGRTVGREDDDTVSLHASSASPTTAASITPGCGTIAASASRVHVHASRDEEVLLPVDNGDEAFVVESDDIAVQAARLLAYCAATKADAGACVDTESDMAKMFASEIATECAIDAMKIHGGYGYSTEYEVERLYRDAIRMSISEGTNDVLRTVVAESLVKGSVTLG